MNKTVDFDSKAVLRKNHPLLAFLEPLETKTVTFKRRSVSLLPFGPDKFLWLILSGWLMGLRGNSDGDMKGTGLNCPGDMLGLTAFSGVTQDVPFYALGGATVMRIPTRDFTSLMDESPELSRYMVSYISERYIRLMEELETSALLPLAQRIDNFMRQTESIPNRESNVPKTVIAFAVGAHPVSVSRLLNSG